MTQVADAPWIREAELYGAPPYYEPEFPTSDIAEEFAAADEFISKAIRCLNRAAVFADDFMLCKDNINALVMQLEDFQSDMKDEQKKIEGGDYE